MLTYKVYLLQKMKALNISQKEMKTPSTCTSKVIYVVVPVLPRSYMSWSLYFQCHICHGLFVLVNE